MSKLKKMDPIFLKCESHVIQNIPSQSLQKSHKNGTTSHANRCQHGPKSRSGGGLGSFWAAPGGSWASPGSKAPLCRFPGAFWAAFRWFLKRLGRLLGGSWAILGTKFGRPGGILERFIRIFMDQVHLYLWFPILIGFEIDFERFRVHFVKAKNQVNVSRLAFSLFFLYFRAETE